jgi:uncharacterized membrane protein
LKTALSFNKLVLAFFTFIAVLIAARIIYSGRFGFIFLIWNLFLAWLPFIISTGFKKIQHKQKWKQLLVFFAWLLIFPNALYIVTDLIHLDLETVVPKWYDAILLFTSCITGLMLAFASLLKVERFLLFHFNSRMVHTLVVAILFLGSFGVYLGRFLRWNSWDIISNPLGLLLSITQRFIFPFEHLRTWCITIILTTLFYLLYAAIKKMPGYVNQAMQ